MAHCWKVVWKVKWCIGIYARGSVLDLRESDRPHDIMVVLSLTGNVTKLGVHVQQGKMVTATTPWVTNSFN